MVTVAGITMALASLGAVQVANAVTSHGSLPSKTPSDVNSLLQKEDSLIATLKKFPGTKASTALTSWKTTYAAELAAQSRAASLVTSDIAVKSAPPKTAASPYPNGEAGDKDFAVASLQVQNDGTGDIGGTIRITNVGKQTLTVVFTVTFFATKSMTGNPLGSAEGSAMGVAPGQTVTETLVSENPMFSQSTYWYQFQVNEEG